LQVKEPKEAVIALVLNNLNGYRTGLFPNQLAFDYVVKELVNYYKTPLKSGVTLIKALLVNAVEECTRISIEGYPRLREEVLYLVNYNIIKCEEMTVKHLMAFVEAQQAFMNVRHPDFLQKK
jgi:hypothetical protein